MNDLSKKLWMRIKLTQQHNLKWRLYHLMKEKILHANFSVEIMPKFKTPDHP